MIPTLVFDLETLPDVAGLRALHPEHAGLDDEELLALIQAERRERTGSEFLPLHLQRIAAIGCVFRDAQGFRVKCLGTVDDTEASLVQAFFKTIDRYTPQLVSWNGSGFDLPVLHYRAMVYGVPAARYWDLGDDDRDFKYNNYISRYHTRHLDLMDVLAKYAGRGAAPLDQMAKLCGFPGKLGMDGSQVWSAWQAGRRNEVRAYCETDVVNTWLLTLRFRHMRGQLTREAYNSEIDLVRQTLSELPGEHWREYLAAWPDNGGRL
jgi:predicted PolB exonuclease-like 3'-5' exonuclease